MIEIQRLIAKKNICQNQKTDVKVNLIFSNVIE